MPSRTFYLSFADDGFRGACILDISEADADVARRTLPSTARHGAEWIAAAITRAWRERCNPGGEVAAWEITDHPHAARFPRNRLLSKADLLAIDDAIDADQPVT